MAAAWIEQREDPKSQESTSTRASACSSTPSGSSATTNASRGASRSEAQSQTRASRTSTSRRSASSTRAFASSAVRLDQVARERVVTGATGTGKSYVACALAQQACRRGFRALYRRVPRLFEELTLAHADGTYSRLLTRFANRRLHPRRLGSRAPATKSGATCSRFSTTATATAPRSSPATRLSKSGTTTSPIRPSPTPCSTASCIMPTASC